MSGENLVGTVVNTVVNTVTSTVGGTVNALTGGAAKGADKTVSKLDPARWQGYSHDELYKLLHDGPGATASALPTQRWSEIALTLADVDADLRGALNRSADGWRGGAASVAYERLGTLATWADSAGQSAGAMRDATQRQAENIARARADMPAPTKVPTASPDPTAAPAMQVLALQGDQETPDAAASAGEQSAHDVMTTYQLNTESTVESLGTFVAPERVATPRVDAHGHGHGHGIGLTTPSGLIDGLLGGIIGGNGNGNGNPNPHGNNGNHGGFGGGGGTSSSGAGWGGDSGPGRSTTVPEPSSGGRPTGGYSSPLLPGLGYDREESRRANNIPGRTSMPGTSGPVSGIEFTSGPGGGPGGGLNGAGSFNGVLGGPNSALPNGAAPGAHGLTSANPAAAALNPNEMPPPAAAAGSANTMTSGTTGGGGVTGASAGHGGADRLLGRRGFESSIGTGNGSWLAEPEPAAPSSVSSGSTPRRRDFKAQVRLTEKVTVDGKDVQLPERVIGGRRGEDEER
ncbi:hypothetical protein [Labedaea rhizosphaerae]|uniref:PPE family protein n=1 Tax=Labedaea rhizosphaerae TaxID=598644 RepID=A0A4R6S4G6_LABRH|nr:hypothetical protein [Labedaea rhizosphaerae]TDP93636.1 hypothetical protein EV186_10630 [Labedaea rhizosphaerae]